MAKNRTMAIKHSMAKKWAMKEILEDAKTEMCCKLIPKNYNPIFCTKHNNDNVFYSKYAIQRRIDALVGTHYPAQEFIKDWSDIYEYLITHTVPEARQYLVSIDMSIARLQKCNNL
jgi:hypothetical protein